MRRPRFSLRTLLIVVTLLIFVTLVVVVCDYVGRQAQIVHQRQSMLKRWPTGAVVYSIRATIYREEPQPGVPWIRQFLKDDSIHEIILHESTSDEDVANY